MAQQGMIPGAGGMPPHQMPPNMQMQHQMQQQQPPQQPQAQQQQQQQQNPQQRQEDKLISKARELMDPLKRKWAVTLKSAVHKVNANGGLESLPSEQEQLFESNLEDFYVICDQVELNLKSAIDCLSQASSSNRYMPIPPHPSRMEAPGPQSEFLSYPQYVSTSKQQVNFANEIKNLLNQAASDVVEQKYNT